MPSDSIGYPPNPRAAEERRLRAMTFHERKAERIARMVGLRVVPKKGAKR